jgi:hypothetical protein
MSEKQIQDKLEIYQAAFKELYDMAVKDIQKLRGTQGQANESDTQEIKERMRQVLFGYRRDEKFTKG